MNDTIKNFLGVLPPNDVSVSMIPVPLESTVSYGKGTAKAPNAIISASRQVELYDHELDSSPYEIGIQLMDEIKCDNRKIEDVLLDVENKVYEECKNKRLPFIIGGEHSISPAVVRGVLKCFDDVTVVQFDAHADLRDEYEGTKCSHASAMARIREVAPAVQIGIRSLSKEEADLIKKNNWPVFFADWIHSNKNWINDIIKEIKTEKVYVTFDVDGFDSSILPETGTPEPGGLGWYDVLEFFKKLMTEKNVVGMDVVELAPRENHHAADFMIAKLIYKMIGYYTLSRKA